MNIKDKVKNNVLSATFMGFSGEIIQFCKQVHPKYGGTLCPGIGRTICPE